MCAMTDPNAPALERQLSNFNGHINPNIELSKSMFGDNGVLIYPGHPETAPKHNQTIVKVVNISYTCVFNTLDVAITSVPLGLTSDGLPVGVQIIGKPFNDRLTIALAEELDKGLGGCTAPAPVMC
ncbi:unnamed protein product, partial [Medioppia subpectinata]